VCLAKDKIGSWSQLHCKAAAGHIPFVTRYNELPKAASTGDEWAPAMMTRCRPLRCGQGSHFPSHTLSHFPSHSCHTPPPHLAVITLCHKVTLGTVMHCPCSTLLLSRPPGLPPAQCNSTWHPQSCSATPAAPARWQAAQPAPDSSTNQSTQLAPDGLQRTLIKNTISSVTEPFKSLQHTQQHPAHNCHN
jgi:hypothetical protein